MKYFAIASLALVLNNIAEAVPCNRPVDPKKIVLMLAFNDAGTEISGAQAGACARGERLVIFPQLSREAQQAKNALATISRRTRAICSELSCPQSPQLTALEDEYRRASAIQEANKSDIKAQLAQFAADSKAQGAKVNSLILSGHDGGGEYYGDTGRTDLAEISELVNGNREVFDDTSSLLLMGCWTGVPDQVDLWKTIFPRMRVLGGFVGSAPASTRAASGQYITGILRGEANLPNNASRARVQQMINTIQNINQVTAGVYINPTCEDDSSRSPAYYYVSPSQSDNELPEHIRPGLSIYQGVSMQEANCRRTFGHEGTRGTYDWDAVQQYYSGKREPENNNELRSLYSFLRNSEYCFTQGFATPAVTPEQVLFLRFFQDMKKNFNKYFKTDLDNMYLKLDALVEASDDTVSKAAYSEHKKLVGDTLLGMNRRDTLKQISTLTGVFEKIASKNPAAPGLAEIRNGMQKLDLHLFRMKCMPPTWHEFDAAETLAAPTCSE